MKNSGIMAGLKGVFLFVAAIAVVVPGYFLTEGIYSQILKGTTPVSAMLSNMSRLNGPLRRSEQTKNGYSTTTVMSQVEKSRNLSDSPSGQCYHRVQVYDVRTSLKSLVSCPNKCVMEITAAGGKDGFAGMDAVVFNVLSNERYLPKPLPPANMNPDQTWVFFSWESPRSNALRPRSQELPVNAMWTYHRRSDIHYPYGYYDPRTPLAKEAKSVDEWLQGKTKFALWMASNCRFTSWPRTDFVRQLKKYIPVDMYGPCGNLECPRSSTKCNVDLVPQYKFYLSLENSECEDYITEKAWGKPLMQGVVPVVYGPQRKIYEELLPPNSFIYIGDYKNISELANYLKLLDSKPELYVQYLKWQYQGTVRENPFTGEPYNQLAFCDLIPVIDRVKKGELKRTPVSENGFPKTCRQPDQNKKTASVFGLGNWTPW